MCGNNFNTQYSIHTEPIMIPTENRTLRIYEKCAIDTIGAHSSVKKKTSHC